MSDLDAIIAPVMDTTESSTVEASEDTQSSQGDNTEDVVETTTEDTSTEEVKDVPFHEHPRFQEVIKEKNELKKLLEEQGKKLDELSNPKKEQEQGVEIPPWFGGDAEAWSQFQDYTQGLTKAAREEAIQEIKAQEENHQKLVNEATEHMNSEVEAIEKEYKTTVDKNKLFKIVQDNNLIDKDNKWNYKVGYTMLQQQEELNKLKGKGNTEDRKDFASLSDTKSDPIAPNVASADTFKSRSW